MACLARQRVDKLQLASEQLQRASEIVWNLGVQHRVEAVAAFIEEEQTRKSLHLHPDDIALLTGHELGIAMTPDSGMTRGSVRLDSGEGWIEDGPDVQLSRLKAMLDTMEDGAI